jgi:hypothetical protein
VYDKDIFGNILRKRLVKSMDMLIMREIFSSPMLV